MSGRTFRHPSSPFVWGIWGIDSQVVCIFYFNFLRSHIIIPCKFEADFDKIDSLLDVPSMVLINHHLPASQQHRWRLLFSTQIHGESFSSFIHQITNQGPVVLVVRDTSGHIFGGFASMSWAIKSHFVGMCNSLTCGCACCSE